MSRFVCLFRGHRRIEFQLRGNLSPQHRTAQFAVWGCTRCSIVRLR